ncbi:MAG: hypothetical protein COT81_01425 [Candidatus Buchananbacteria bacterium CG10_big_fil_rev_8_21_14_0_10_42_9]|uniref:Uncharacterized protein n=1 Tax=Candidatus Buchananbacteria bacterium CG10_big_fil_rev_8_21_14_0_10_42_9 TaxID=1974526 RepID=A0A2H0W231_9BACT|nr:MAG: hypothetical protein COT81_01425 [Candidatus Buchananbacteria bacterium CG10_big_fil_rev_8_21_14_0_10_42_9]
MGFWNAIDIFGLSAPMKVFTGKMSIKRALWKMSSLDYKQRKIVYDALVEKLGGGGVTRLELLDVARKLHMAHKISDIDRRALEHLIEEIKERSAPRKGETKDETEQEAYERKLERELENE